MKINENELFTFLLKENLINKAQNLALKQVVLAYIKSKDGVEMADAFEKSYQVAFAFFVEQQLEQHPLYKKLFDEAGDDYLKDLVF